MNSIHWLIKNTNLHSFHFWSTNKNVGRVLHRDLCQDLLHDGLPTLRGGFFFFFPQGMSTGQTGMVTTSTEIETILNGNQIIIPTLKSFSSSITHRTKPSFHPMTFSSFCTICLLLSAVGILYFLDDFILCHTLSLYIWDFLYLTRFFFFFFFLILFLKCRQ